MTDRMELVRSFNAIEERAAPYSIRLEGAPLWPLLRVSSGYRNLLPEMAPQIAQPRIGHIERLGLLGKGMAQWASLATRTDLSPLLFFSSRTYQSMTDLGMVDRFAYPLMEAATKLGRSSILLARERPANGELMVPPGAQLKHMDALLYVRDLWHWQKPIKPLCTIPGIGRIPEILEEAFGERAVRYLDKAIHNFRQHLAFARSLLRRIRPAHVFVTCWYSVDNMAMAHACHELRIPCTDLQHGVQGPAHIAYGAWKAMPAEGCSTIPSYFWCWDEASVRNIVSWAPIGHHQAFVGGSPWLDREHSSQTSDPGQGNGILFTLQPVDQPLPDHLLAAIQRDPLSRQWVFRLHPNALHHKELITQWAREGGIMDRVMIEDPRTIPLQLSLRRATLHVTLFSSVVLESSYLGIPSIALHPNAAALFPDLLNGPLLELATGQEHLTELLTKPRSLSRMGRPERSVNQVLEQLLNRPSEKTGA